MLKFLTGAATGVVLLYALSHNTLGVTDSFLYYTGKAQSAIAEQLSSAPEAPAPSK